MNLVKSDIGRATVTYLAHVVGQGQVLPVLAKVKAIYEYAVPKNKKALMRFLGMIGFYRKSYKNFAHVTAPLTGLLKKSVNFVWSNECQRSFDKAKEILMNAPVLTPPDYEKVFRLYCDASDIGVGAVLCQVGSGDVEQPVGFFSKKLDKCQQNYATIEKEALSLLLALKHFEVYLTSSPFQVEVYTDHNPLTFVNRMKLENQRLLRWSLTLQEWNNLKLMHIIGCDNVVADALSRV